VCIYKNKSENSCTYPKRKLGGIQTKLRIKDCKQNNTMDRLPTNEESN
jgi:hypothetical protein